MQHLLEAAWFYCRLSCAVLWNSFVFSIQLHFTTRSFMSVFGLFVCICLLFAYRLVTWQTAFFSDTNYSISSTIKSALINSDIAFDERVCTSTSCLSRRESLSELYAQQPTHRDVLINLLLVSDNQATVSDATESLLTTVRRLDPNHPLVERLK